MTWSWWSFVCGILFCYLATTVGLLAWFWWTTRELEKPRVLPIDRRRVSR